VVDVAASAEVIVPFVEPGSHREHPGNRDWVRAIDQVIIRRAEGVEREAPMNQADIELMNSLNWYHKIDLVGGRVTPGREWDHL